MTEQIYLVKHGNTLPPLARMNTVYGAPHLYATTGSVPLACGHIISMAQGHVHIMKHFITSPTVVAEQVERMSERGEA